jgi:SAM-dependent methyltransferase
MSETFGPAYSEAYDALYADKDYDAECDLLESIFHDAGRSVRAVLDLGCGTGAHAVRLAARGYEVTGVDLSEGMLSRARSRADAVGAAVELVQGDVRTVRLHRRFDAVVCMFAVLGYQTTDQDVLATLRTVREHLTSGGVFVFDVWYGPAVEAIGPSERAKVASTGDGELERQGSGILQPDAHLCTVHYRLIDRRPGVPDKVTDEVHRMRYFFPDELQRSLADAGLSLRALAPFPDNAARLSAADWNVLVTAVG